MKYIMLRGVSVRLIALGLLVAVFAVPALAQEEYQVTTTLLSPEPESGAEFGGSMAFSGEIVVIGANSAKMEGKSYAGRAFIFDSDGNLQAALQAPEPDLHAYFGWSVAVSGDIVLVGEPLADVVDAGDAGRAYIFDSDGNLLETLQAPEPQAYANFGWSVAVSGDIVIIGEHIANVGGKIDAGRAYIFDSDGNLLETLQSPEPESGAEFGGSVAVSGDTVVIGESGADVEGKIIAGRAYIFDSDGNLLETLQAPEPESGAHFGGSVAVSGETVVVGEPSARAKAGRAYVFRAGAAAFTMSSLSVDPSSVDVGGTITISVEVTNTGGQSGSHTVTLKIDGEVEDEKTVTLNPDETETVSFEVSAAQQGSFSVEVDGLSGRYTVTKPIEEKQKPPGGIPGFPYESIIIGLVVGVFMLWLLQRRR